jgi:ERCC4-type nuclease
MRIIIDEREHDLFEKCMILLYQSQNTICKFSKKVLPLGDIILCKTDDEEALHPILVIERKSLTDLVASIKDGRYEEQSYRLLNSSEMPPHSIVYLVEGMFSTLRNPTDKKIIQSAITSLAFFKGFSIQRTATLQETAEWLIHLAEKIGKELGKGRELWNCSPLVKYGDAADYCSVVKKVKKENITPENIGEIMLCQIPGISSVTAIAIMKHFEGGFPHFLEELKNNPASMENIYIECGAEKKRKISKSSVENIRKYLLPNSGVCV